MTRACMLVTMLLMASPSIGDDKLGVESAIQSAEEALKPIDPVILNIKYANGLVLSKALESSRRDILNARKVIEIKRERRLGLADEFLLFNIMTGLRANTAALSESLRSVEGAFGESRPNSLAGEWDASVQRSLTLISKSAISIEDDLYVRLDDADKRLAAGLRK